MKVISFLFVSAFTKVCAKKTVRCQQRRVLIPNQAKLSILPSEDLFAVEHGSLCDEKRLLRSRVCIYVVYVMVVKNKHEEPAS